MAFFTKPKQLLNQLNQTFKYESVIKKPMKKTLKYYEPNFLPFNLNNNLCNFQNQLKLVFSPTPVLFLKNS